MATSYTPLPMNCCSIQKRPSALRGLHLFKQSTISSILKPISRVLFPQVPLQIDLSKMMKYTATKLVDAFVDHVFEFVDHPLLPSQINFAPVEELGEATPITSIQGEIPHDFPEGVYIRNGSNPLFGGLKGAKSIFGSSNQVWVEGEGMLHALYFKRQNDGRWTVVYNNRHIETDTYKLEKKRNKPSFLPALKGDAPAILAAYLLNMLRFGRVNKCYSNTSVFEHSGKLYSVAETDIPQEIDIFSLNSLKNWDIGGAWKRSFTSHPKKAPGTGELVLYGVDPAAKAFFEVGIVSADGKLLIHRVAIELNRQSFCHEIGVTQSYNVIMDFPLILDPSRLLRGGKVIKFENEGYARIGVMPRYGDNDSIKWFEVKNNCTFHIFNSFEDDHEVILWGCRAIDTVLPEPNVGWDKFKFPRCYEWRLNMQTGEVKEKFLTGEQYLLDFPLINENFTGIRNKYGYAQVVDPTGSIAAGTPIYGGLAKLYFEESCSNSSTGKKQVEELIKVEYHMFEKNVFCSGSTFAPKEGGLEEDDGWIVSFVHNEDTGISQLGKKQVEELVRVEYHMFEKNVFCSGSTFVPNSKAGGLEEDDSWIISFVHNEDTGISQVYIIDTKEFSDQDTVARVPYGFHGAFLSIPLRP
ncbi:hypothetical protein L6164_002924 [Bauhinia variegata]|uniref:Uncharacterized protein n=1 Tax=Bauhinia variegata TaxID=167791 RepID=A0ACB9PZQ5_BAUVA|nr:hypothetical protein L6164_002924 [Bauhinia variegata]